MADESPTVSDELFGEIGLLEGKAMVEAEQRDEAARSWARARRKHLKDIEQIRAMYEEEIELLTSAMDDRLHGPMQQLEWLEQSIREAHAQRVQEQHEAGEKIEPSWDLVHCVAKSKSVPEKDQWTATADKGMDPKTVVLALSKAVPIDRAQQVIKQSVHVPTLKELLAAGVLAVTDDGTVVVTETAEVVEGLTGAKKPDRTYWVS